MAITRTPIVDDDGTGTTGTVLDNAWKQQFYDQIDAVMAGSTTSVTTVTASGGVTTPAGQIRWVQANPSSAEITLSGVTAGNTGDLLIVQNTGYFTVWLTYGTGPGQFLNHVTSGPTPLARLGAAIYLQLGGGSWIIVSHEQGAPIAVPFNAANYSGGTATAANISRHDYVLRGKMLTYGIMLANFPASGSSSTVAVKGTPYQFVPELSSKPNYFPITLNAGGSWQGGLAAVPDQTTINLSRYDFANFTGSIHLFFSHTLPVV